MATDKDIAMYANKLRAWEETAEHYCAADTPISPNGVREYVENLRAQNAALVAAGKRILAFGNIFRYKETEVSPYEQLKAAIEAAESDADNE